MQESVDGYYDTFVDNVAKFRGVKTKDVRNGFGEGRVLSAKQCVSEGMCDKVMTLEALLADLSGGRKGRRAKKPTATQMKNERKNKSRRRQLALQRG